MTIEEYRKISLMTFALSSLARKLQKQYENQCNLEESPRRTRLIAKLQTQADKIAASLGLIAYHQTDPRGWPLWIIEKRTEEKGMTEYHHGVGFSGRGPHADDVRSAILEAARMQEKGGPEA